MSAIDNTLYKAYLDCLFLDREALQHLSQHTQNYESAVLAAQSLVEHIRSHPRLSALKLPESKSIKTQDLPILLDYLHRSLWRLIQKGNQDSFLQTLQQELAYLIPRLWNPPRAQQTQVKEIMERIASNAQIYQNHELIQKIDSLDSPSATQLLQYVDESLTRAWPQQLGLIIAKVDHLRHTIQTHSVVEGIEWKSFENLGDVLQQQFYREPNMIIVSLDQPRVSLDRLLENYPNTEVIGVVEKMDQLKSHMLPAKIQHIFEEQWLSRFLPALIRRNLRKRWQDTRSLTKDFLTGMPSLMGMREQNIHLQDLFSRVKAPMTLAILELPILKQIESNEGPYLAGEWLKSFARFLKDCLRNTDRVGRWSPDKFICILPQTHLEGAQIAFQRCLEKLPRELNIPVNEEDKASALMRGGMAIINKDIAFEQALFNAYFQLQRSKTLTESPFAYDQKESQESVKPHILLLDDDPIIQEMLRFVFSREGYRVTQLTNGREILPTLEKNPTSLVLLDIMMPGMDGFEVLETIRSQRQYDSLPVVILSSMKGESDLEKGFSLGADDYIYKPFSPSELVIRIRRFLKS